MSQVIILGWDALDADLIHDYGLAEQFGGEVSRIETYANPVINEPHTRELWPSIITGLHPDEHGIHAVEETDGVNWDNPAIDLAASLASGVVPHEVRTVIGKWLREQGAGLDAKRPGYYREHGIPTIFDDGGRVISVPNYVTGYDQQHELDANRDDVWGAILPGRDGSEGLEPNVPLAAVYHTIFGAVGERVGHTLAAIQQGHDVVFTWFGLLDTVGHIAPAVEGPIEESAYRHAARLTQSVRDHAPADATVVSVSDHGLQAGEHTHYATLASADPAPHDRIGSVFDVAGWVSEARSGNREEAGYAYGEGIEATTDQLEQLGYVEP
jgi:hypothetical protein